MGECPPVQHRAGVIKNGDVVRPTGPVPADTAHSGLPAAEV